MPGYVFLSNSTKPTEEQLNSREEVKLSSVSLPCLQTALEMGYDVYLGVNRTNPTTLYCKLPVKLYDSHTYRSIIAFKDNMIAYNNLKRIVQNNSIKAIHCNTPVGGMIGRLVGRKYNVYKVIYTAHGFHFYKGAPFINCTIFKWAEQIMAHWTDAIITMNEEDYQAARKFKLKKGGRVYKVHGVGIDLKEFENASIDRELKRRELGFKPDDILCISAGDLVKGKNNKTSIKALAKTNNSQVHYLICGVGPERKKLEKFAKKHGVSERVHFLGFRTDIKELMKASDVFLFNTLREGLPRSLMEAMACGLPCVASRIRGNIDLLDNGKGGFICGCKDVKYIAKSINELSKDKNLRATMGNYNLNIIKQYDLSVVKNEIEEIYNCVLMDKK